MIEFCAHYISLDESCPECDHELMCPNCKSINVILHEESIDDGGRYCKECHSDFFKKDMVSK